MWICSNRMADGRGSGSGCLSTDPSCPSMSTVTDGIVEPTSANVLGQRQPQRVCVLSLKLVVCGFRCVGSNSCSAWFQVASGSDPPRISLTRTSTRR